MGNKCQFCETFLGNVKRVCGVLQGDGCGCGKCNGQIADRLEAKTMFQYYQNQLESLEKTKAKLTEFQVEIEEKIAKLREIKYVK